MLTLLSVPSKPIEGHPVPSPILPMGTCILEYVQATIIVVRHIISYCVFGGILQRCSVLSVELVGSGSREVGSVYTLTCTVALSHRASDSSVSILWEGPSTHEQTVDTTDSRLVTRQLSLDPLSLADGGDYTCTASYTADGGTTVTEVIQK